MAGHRVDRDAGADGWLDGFIKRPLVGEGVDMKKGKQEIIESFGHKGGVATHQTNLNLAPRCCLPCSKACSVAKHRKHT